MSKVTLANLQLVSAERAFVQMFERLADGKGRAMEDGTCVYRTSDGLACAAGALMSDEEAKKVLEEFYALKVGEDSPTWHKLLEHGCVPAAHAPLIILMQKVHDSPRSWNGNTLTKEGLEQLHDIIVRRSLRVRICPPTQDKPLRAVIIA